MLESISREQRSCGKNDGVVRRVCQKWRSRRIRLDPQPGVDDAHHEDDADLEKPVGSGQTSLGLFDQADGEPEENSPASAGVAVEQGQVTAEANDYPD